MPFNPFAIERDDPIERARHTASVSRVAIGVFGIVLILDRPEALPLPAAGIAGFAVIVLTAFLQLANLRIIWTQVEETFAATAAILIIGVQDEWVNAISLLWLVALAAGVMARGGRVHWIGRTVVLVALVLPIVRSGALSLEYAAFCLAVVALQLTAGRLTVELNRLLRQARHDAENAETLLLAGEIASRVDPARRGRDARRRRRRPPPRLPRPGPGAERRRGRPHPRRARPPDRRRRPADGRPADRRPALRPRPRLRGARPLRPPAHRPQPAALVRDRR